MSTVVKYIAAVVLLHSTAGCARKETFDKIGAKLASPTDIVSSQSGDYFYVLNADMDRTFDQGSILVLDNDGNRIQSIPTQRLGRSLTAAGGHLIATFDDPGDEPGENPRVELYDISDEKSPKLVEGWPTDCTPINAALSPGYRYFAITCQLGSLWIGDISEKTLKKVRKYNWNRRAIYLDAKRELLFSFVTDLGEVRAGTDMILDDVASWDDDLVKTDGENEVPDEFEDTREHTRLNRGSRQRYQFTVYDLKSEAEEEFPFREDSDPIAAHEYRWLYFNLTNFDGTPDDEASYTKLDQKYYRTNFWEAKADERNSDIFYLSHRGLGTATSSPHANSIVQVEITADPRTPSDGKNLKTKDYLSFRRIFGFGGSQNSPDKLNYVGDFEFVRNGGMDSIIVNNFRDLANFRAVGGARFTVSAATLDPAAWYSEIASTNGYDGYYQLATGNDHVVATCSFYGNAVILLEVRPGADIREIKRIN